MIIVLTFRSRRRVAASGPRLRRRSDDDVVKLDVLSGGDGKGVTRGAGADLHHVSRLGNERGQRDDSFGGVVAQPLKIDILRQLQRLVLLPRFLMIRTRAYDQLHVQSRL